MSKKIRVVGAHSSAMVMSCPRFPTVGEYIIGGKYYRSLDGGKGSNQALAAARLGGEVHFYSKLGKDEQGRFALEYLGEEGVEMSGVSVSEEGKTSMGVCFLDGEGQIMGVTDMGVLDEYREEELASVWGDWCEGEILLVQLELPSSIVHASLKRGSECGLKTLLNPAPFERDMDIPWEHVDILTPNEPEARLIAGHAPDAEVEMADLFGALYEKTGVGELIVTAGESGVFHSSGGGEARHYPCPKVEAVDTSGAGDAFSAALAVYLSRATSLEDSIAHAVNYASVTVQHSGSWESYLDAKAFGAME